MHGKRLSQTECEVSSICRNTPPTWADGSSGAGRPEGTHDVVGNQHVEGGDCERGSVPTGTEPLSQF